MKIQSQKQKIYIFIYFLRHTKILLGETLAFLIANFTYIFLLLIAVKRYIANHNAKQEKITEYFFYWVVVGTTFFF